MKSTLSLAVALVAALVLALPAAANAAWTAQEIGTANSCRVTGPCGSIATDIDGNSYAAWVENDTYPILVGSYRPAGGAWGAPETIDAHIYLSDAIDVAFDGEGRVYVTWQGTTGNSNSVMARVRAADATWGTATVIGTGSSTAYPYYDDMPEIAVNSAGEAVVGWTGYSTAYVASLGANGVWDTATALPGGATSKSIGVGIDDTGEATVVWSSYDSVADKQQLRQATWVAGADAPASGTDLLTPVATENDQPIRVNVAVAPGGAAVAAYALPPASGGTSSAGHALYRTGDGTWETSPTALASRGKPPLVGMDAEGGVVALWPDPAVVRGYQAVRRGVLSGWSSPVAVASELMHVDYDLAVAPDGAALLALIHYDYTASSGGAHTVTMSTAGNWGTPTGPLGSVDNTRPVRASIGNGGAGAVFWRSGDQYANHRGWVAAGTDGGTDPGDGGTDPGDGGSDPGDGGSTGSTTTTTTSSAPTTSFNDALTGSEPPRPVTTDTTQLGKMPKVVGMRVDKAKDAIDRAGIVYSDVDLSWSRSAPRGFSRGDVVAQSPKPGASVVNGIDLAPRIRLSVFQGPKGAAGKKCAISTLSRDLKGADFTLVEDLLAKTKCKTNWDVKLGAKDDAELSRLRGKGSRVTASITCPKSSEDHDLFAFVREYPSGLSFGAGDWALTVSNVQRNSVRLTVLQRGGYVENGVIKGQLVKNARLLIDTSDVGGTDSRALPTDANGTTEFTLAAHRPGKVDICIIGETSDGATLYGATQLTVVNRKGDFDTVGGRHMKKTGPGSWKDAAINDGPILVRESANRPTAQASLDLFGPIVSAVQSLLSGLNTKIATTLSGSGSPQVRVKAVQKNYNFSVGQFGFGQPIGGQPNLIQVVWAKLVGQAGSNAIAAGGGNAIAAGGGNVIAAGGGNLVGQAGSNAIAAGGGNLVQASTDLKTGRAIAAGGYNLVGQAGTNAIAAGGGNLIGPAGTNAIAVGGGNAIAAGGGN